MNYDGCNKKTVDQLRDEGFAVTVFNPDELRGAPAERIEESMVDAGWITIDMLATEPLKEEDD